MTVPLDDVNDIRRWTRRASRGRRSRGVAGIKYFDGEVTPEKLGYSFYADRNSPALSDTVILNGTYLCIVSEVTPPTSPPTAS